MITIKNISKEFDQNGLQQYEVKINGKFICNFKHIRSNGLGICLLEASKAVERDKWMKIKEMLDVSYQDNF